MVPIRLGPFVLPLLFASLALLACRTLQPSPSLAEAPASTPESSLATRPAAPDPGRISPTLPPAGQPRESTEDLLARLGGRLCPNSELTCVTIRAPLDHFDPANPATLEVVFGVLPAAGERHATLVIAVGGPGGSGLAVADSYTPAFDPSITEQFDLVFFDQRGGAASGGLQCTRAAADYYRITVDTRTPEGEASFSRAAQAFASECVREAGSPEWLPFLGTEQAVEDLELFRQAMQVDRFWLYGESYGTQFAQTYAAAYPGRLAGLILDGPVDLTLSGLEYLQEQAAAFNSVLLMTLSACSRDGFCFADLGGDPLAAYDDLAARLRAGPIRFRFPLPDGRSEERPFTLADLETAAASYLYSEPARMILLRALAAADGRGDLVPLARMLYDVLSLDPESLVPIPDPTYSDALYYAVECNDYEYGSAEQVFRAGDAVDEGLPRFGSIFYANLPCVFWPEDPADPPRPQPLVAEGIPTLVLVGTADPATPPGNAVRIFGQLADGYLVLQAGGPHVLYGWGNACVDDLVTDFLVRGIVPLQRVTSCEGVVISGYVPLAPADISQVPDLLEAMVAVDNEMYYLPEYFYWDGFSSVGIGCPFGGGLRLDPLDSGERIRLTDCGFIRGFLLTGTGLYDYDSQRFSLEVSVSGTAAGSLLYVVDPDGSARVSGEYAGKPVNLSD